MQALHSVGRSVMLAFVALNCALGTAHADCEGVYESATRDVLFTETSFSALFSLYDNTCESTGEVKGRVTDAELGLVIKQVPVKFKVGLTNNREIVTNFCREYREVRFDQGNEQVRVSNVVIEALSNFNTCMAIQSNYGIDVVHRFVNPGAIIFDFTFRGTGQVLSVSDVPHSDNLECTSSNIGADGQLITLGDNQVNMEARSNFNIVCRREGVKDAGGGERFEPGYVGIATTSGSYTVSMPGDAIYSAELASDAKRQIDSLIATTMSLSENLRSADEEQALLELTINELNGKIDGAEINHHVVTLGTGPGPGTPYGCGVSLEQAKRDLCPNATKITTEQNIGARTGGCGTATYVFACLRQ